MNRALASTTASFAVAMLLALALGGTAMAQSAAVMTDQSDYAPGTIVTITGSGWQPGETVTLSFVESPFLDTHPDLYVTADANGNIFNNQFSPDDHDIGITFILTATGQTSGLQAQTTFTDNKNLTITFAGNGAGSVTVTDTTDPTKNETCTATCIDATGNNDVGTITATAASGSSFAGWSLQTSGVTGCSGNNCNFSMGNAAQSVTATFKLNTLAITSVNGGTNPTAGTAFSVVVQAQNGSGGALNVAANTGVTLSLSTGGGTLGGTLTGTIAAGTSIITISGVTYTKAESGVMLRATRTGGDTLTPGDSAAFTVNPGSATTLAVAGYPSPVTAGTANSFTVTAKDANGNVAAGYTGIIHFTSSDAQAVLPANYTFVAGDNGVHTFSATLKTPGTQSITATDTVTASITGTQSGIVVHAAIVRRGQTIIASLSRKEWPTAVSLQ